MQIVLKGQEGMTFSTHLQDPRVPVGDRVKPPPFGGKGCGKTKFPKKGVFFPLKFGGSIRAGAYP
ncbi:hypothetical protein ACISSW_14235 [Escherichia coli]